MTGINALKRFLELREMRLWYENFKFYIFYCHLALPFFYVFNVILPYSFIVSQKSAGDNKKAADPVTDHADQATGLAAVSPDGLVYTLSEALSLHPGLSLETEANDTLAVRNVPFALNGWGFRARFEGPGGVALSSVAYIFVADYVTAYQNILNAYRAAYQAGGHTAQYAVSNNLSMMIAHSSHVGYAFKDLDKDGTPELFIAGLNTDNIAQSVVYDIFALVNGTPQRIAISTENDRYYLCTDNMILNSGNEGAAHTYSIVYRYGNDRITPVESYISYMTGSPKDGYYYQAGAYSPEPRNGDTQLSENTFRAQVREREAKVFQLIYTQIA